MVVVGTSKAKELGLVPARRVSWRAVRSWLEEGELYVAPSAVGEGTLTPEDDPMVENVLLGDEPTPEDILYAGWALGYLTGPHGPGWYLLAPRA